MAGLAQIVHAKKLSSVHNALLEVHSKHNGVRAGSCADRRVLSVWTCAGKQGRHNVQVTSRFDGKTELDKATVSAG